MSKPTPAAQKRGGATEPKPDHPKRPDSADATLDRALEESFPGSDPVSITQPSASKPDKRKAP